MFADKGAGSVDDGLRAGIVTILFTDIVGSTALRTSRGDAAAQTSFDAHDAVVRREVAGHGGHVVKALGDGFMIVFDSVGSALACAAAIQRGQAAHNEAHPHAAVSVRMGLNSGEVIRQEDDFQGVTVNAAARVSAKAKGGEILISDVVRQLMAASPGVPIRPRGRVQLKGFTERWRLHEVLWEAMPAPAETQRPTPARPAVPVRDNTRPVGMGFEPDVRPVLCPVLVGRADEVTALREVLEQAGRDTGSMVLILGEPGAGKSRLAREAVSLADEQGWVVLTGRAVPSTTPVAFRPLAEALLSALRSSGLPDDPGLEPFRPALGRLVPQWRRAGASDADDSIVLLAEGVLQVLRALADGRACLLLLEDLHWSDPETLAVVEYLADNLATEPVACLVTMRTDERSDAMALARALRARRTGRVVELDRLGPAEVAQMAEACLGHGRIPDEAGAALRNWADGVPFLVEELLASWLGSATLVRSADGWSVQGKIEPAVPLTFADIVGRRLSTLGAGGQTVLQAASVIGRRFDWNLLPVMTDRREDAVLEVLRQATDAQLIAPDVERAGFKFRHALTRDAIIDTLLPPQRQALARSALRAVQTAHPGLPGEWCELSVELALDAGDAAAAARLMLEAGRRAMARGALRTAESLLRRGRAVGDADDTTRDGLDDALCETLALAGQVDQAAEAAAELLARLQARPGTEMLQARVHLRLARVTASADRWDDADAHLEATAAFCPAGADGVLDAHRAGLAAQVAVGRGDVSLAQRLAAEALAQAEAAGQPAQVCEALEVQGRCHRVSDLEAAEVAFERARRVAAEHGLTLWQLRATHELGAIDVLRGGPLDRLDSTARLARESGALFTAAHVDLQRGFWFFDFHRFDESLAAGRQAADSAARFHLSVLSGLAHFQQGVVHAIRDDADEMERAIAAGSDLCAGAPFVDEFAANLRAMRRLRNDEREQALKELSRVMVAVRRYGGAPSPLPGLCILLRACTGDDTVEDRAAVLGSAAGPRLQTHAYFDYADAVEAGRIGERARAEDLAARAGAFMCRYPWFHHHSRRLVAEAALDDGWGEPVTWLREARAFFESEGYEALARACRSLLIRAGDQTVRRRSHDGLPAELTALGITRRELDVLELLADGRPTREIAERLYLSPKTVERHIANLAGKTGLAGRAQLVAFAAKQDFPRPG